MVLMKKIIKIALTLVFVPLLIFSVNQLIFDFSDEALAFVILASALFAMHLFAWIAPRTFFNLCWKITVLLPDNFDYDTSFSKLELCDIGILISATLFLVISFFV
jgi:hypothetical protein